MPQRRRAAALAAVATLAVTGCTPPPQPTATSVTMDAATANWLRPGYADGYHELELPTVPFAASADGSLVLARDDVALEPTPSPSPSSDEGQPEQTPAVPQGTTTITGYRTKDASRAWGTSREIAYRSTPTITGDAVWALTPHNDAIVSYALTDGRELRRIPLQSDERVLGIYDLPGDDAVLVAGDTATRSRLLGPRNAWALSLEPNSACALHGTRLLCSSATRNPLIDLTTGRVVRDIPGPSNPTGRAAIALYDGFAFPVDRTTYAVLRDDGTDTGETFALATMPAPRGLYRAKDLERLAATKQDQPRPVAFDEHGQAVAWAQREPLAGEDSLYDVQGRKTTVGSIVGIDRAGNYLASSGVMTTPQGRVIMDAEGLGVIPGGMVVRRTSVDGAPRTLLLVPNQLN